jgi:hypothetical protein
LTSSSSLFLPLPISLHWSTCCRSPTETEIFDSWKHHGSTPWFRSRSFDSVHLEAFIQILKTSRSVLTTSSCIS